MTGTGQFQRPTGEEPDIGFSHPEPPSMLAALPQTVPPSRGTPSRHRAHHPIPKILRTRLRPMKPRFSAPLRQFSVKIEGLRWD
jgi:hypothetical protein